MTVRLQGSTSGYVELDSPAVGGNNTLVLPTNNGTADQVIATNGSGALSFVDRGRMVLETAQAATSGTSIDFTGIPSWVKQIGVSFYGVSTNGTSVVQIQIGSGAFVTSGYSSFASAVDGINAGSALLSTGFLVDPGGSAAFVRYGTVFLNALSSVRWVYSGTFGVNGSASARTHFFGGAATDLSGTLDRIRITTVNGTDTFDAGTINLLLEG
jgi:hypothetical protein